MRRLLLVTFLLAYSLPAWAQTYYLEKNSSYVRFQANTRLHPFEGMSKSMDATMEAEAGEEWKLVFAKVVIPVDSLKTGNTARDHALQHTLRSTDFPLIEFKAEKIRLGSDEVSGRKVFVKGVLSVGGKSSPVEIESDVRLTGRGIEVRSGRIPLSLSMFSLRVPPLARFLGVDDAVLVSFETVWNKEKGDSQ